jgi:hypothetical protein
LWRVRVCLYICERGIFPVNVPVPVPVPGVWEAVVAPSCACCMVFPWHRSCVPWGTSKKSGKKG